VSDELNLYCDESGHLEHDRISVMVLGALICPAHLRAQRLRQLRAIKAQHGLPHGFEIKWTKVSPAKADFYVEVVDWFFSNPDLSFRALITPKAILNHESHRQTHDDFYYKQWFLLLNRLLQPKKTHSIYLDIKDTRSEGKARKLQEVLCNANYDFDRSTISRIQHVRSHQVGLIQVADLLIGAVSYVQRGLEGNAGKQAVIDRIRSQSRLSLKQTTLLRENKFNLLVWHPREF
jgi:hypothetical protein